MALTKIAAEAQLFLLCVFVVFFGFRMFLCTVFPMKAGKAFLMNVKMNYPTRPGYEV